MDFAVLPFPEDFAIRNAAPLVGKVFMDFAHEGLERQKRVAGIRRLAQHGAGRGPHTPDIVVSDGRLLAE
jgi:hypothetical protein